MSEYLTIILIIICITVGLVSGGLLLIKRKGECDAYWQSICQVMDEQEVWRNPNTTVETVSRLIGTNRYYVARCIRKHTGMTFNDYMNRKRVNYMVNKLKKTPTTDQKTLYFEAGFRSRTAAYRNFVKFVGCSPTDYLTKL